MCAVAGMDFSEICRICCEPKPQDMSSILDSDDDAAAAAGSFLQRMFEQVLRLEIRADDGLPQKVCATCRGRLRNMADMIEMARENDSVLRRELLGPTLLEGSGCCGADEEVAPEVELDQLTDLLIDEMDQMQGMVDDNVIIEEVIEEWLLADADADSELCSTDQDDQDSAKQQQQQESSDSGHGSTEETVSEKMSEDGEQQEEEPPKRRRGRPRKRLVSPPPPKRYTRTRVKFSDGNDDLRPRKNDFKCYICKSEPLGSAEALLAHLSQHAGELPYTCPLCVMEKIVVDSVTQLNVHKRMHLNPVKCNYCDRRYHSTGAMEIHVQQHHLGENVQQPVECGKCGKLCSSKQALKVHERLHTSALGCEFCGKLFTGRHKVLEHIRRKHSKKKEFACKLCEKQFSTLLDLQSHVRIKHSQLEFKCNYCERSYSSDQSRRYHEKKHKKNESYRASNRWSSYYTVVESDGMKKKKCNLCHAIVKAIGPHVMTLHLQRKFRCEKCEAEFSTKATFLAHVEEHEKGKAYRCPICQKEFSLKQQLVMHLKTKKHRDHPLSKLYFKKKPTTAEEMFGADMPKQLLDAA